MEVFMQVKESNFVSAVVYLHNCENSIKSFLTLLNAKLSDAFLKYEIIFVNDSCTDGTIKIVKETAAQLNITVPVTIVNMSIYQGMELCMNAGLDIAIGDFVYEFDTTQTGYDEALIFEAYKTALTGFDIVSVSPSKDRSVTSRAFYSLFNKSIKSQYAVHTDIFRVLSRRAINRVHSISPNVPYRKAAYATSGLKLTTIIASNFTSKKSNDTRLTLAVDALAMYTNAAYKLSLGISFAMLFATLLEVFYTVYIYINYLFFDSARPVEGWTTTMLFLTGGFFGVFLILAIVIKYLSLLVELVFKQQKYLVEGIEKL